MKKNLLQFALLLTLMFSISRINAQSLSVTLNSATLCNTSNSTAVSYSITNTYTGTTAYSFSINSACGNYNIGYMFSTTGGLFITCTGPYTLYCSAIGSNSNIILSTAVFTGTIFAPSISISPNNGSACLGTTFSVNLSGNGVSSFTTYTQPAMMLGTQTSSVFAFTPSASACFTVYSIVNGCASFATRCYTLNSSPNVTTTPSVSICYGSGGNSAILYASGASSYTWSNGSFTNATNVSSTVSASYTVTGSVPGCIATSSAVAIVTIIPSPTVSVLGLTTTCPGTPVTYTATGANNYTWYASSTIANQSILTFSNNNCFIVNGIGSNGCVGSSGTVCPLSLPSLTITPVASSSNFCLGGSTNLSASGACQFTWAISNGTLAPIYIYTSSLVFTPTLSGIYTAQVYGSCSGSCAGSSFLTFTVNALPNVTIPSTYSVCSGGYQVGLVASGATSYTWNTGANSNILYVAPIAPTCYTVTGSTNGCVGTSSAVTCVSIVASPSISVLGSTLNCSGSFNTYTAIGGSGPYTWLHPITFASYGSGSVVTIPPSSNGFAVNCYSAIGCNVFGATIYPVYIPSPTITLSSSNFYVCSGNSATVNANGANSYTWSNGNSNNSIVVSPTSSQCYTVTGTNINGCSSSAVGCFTVGTAPNINISGATSACPGSNLIYTASGGTSYVWSNASTSNTVNVNTNSSNCYSVTSWGSNGCSSTVNRCFTPSPVPSINFSGSNTVCIGSSATFTANGGTTYTWNTGANTNTFYVLPTASANYTVKASHAINSCTNSAVVALTVYTNCAVVWPGDANRDGQVDNTDVFELGLAANSTGAARTSASNSWTGHFANAWTGTVSSGWNKVHADCNGNGVINAADTLAISQNYSLTHVFKNTNTSSGIDLFLSPQNSEAYSGIWNVFDIILGDANNIQSQIYGAAFDLDFDKSMVENDSVKLVYNSSFLNAGGQNIEFEKSFFNNGKLFTTSVRTNQSDVNGNGKIAELWIKLRSDVPDNSSFNFGISNGKRVSANGLMGVLNTSGGMNLNVNANATGIKKESTLFNTVRFYPNPANNSITLRNDLNTKTSYRLFDLTGRMILSGEFTSTKNLDVSAINKGIYIIEFETPVSKIQKKLVKE